MFGCGMDHFAYDDGRLKCEGVDLAALAGAVGTPTYVYSLATLRHHVSAVRGAFASVRPTLCFAVKALNNVHVLRELVSMGVGLDVVSGGELARARAAGCPMERVVFAGVGKSEDEMVAALAGPGGPIASFNVESEEELGVLSAVAGRVGVRASACLRVNPDVDAKTHKYTTTGKSENKFGVDIARAESVFATARALPGVDLKGLHVHLGSPIYSVEPYREALAALVALWDRLESAGHRLSMLNVGGGFGADYTTGRTPALSEYADAMTPLLSPLADRGVRIVLEPGRVIAANAGVLLTRVRYLKQGRKRRFVICDAGMNALIRPALYEAFHFVWPAAPGARLAPKTRTERVDLPGLVECDVVGPICESGDFLAQRRMLPPVARGDVMAVFTAGAYGMTMANSYNDHAKPAEVLVDGRRWRLVRGRETPDDLMRAELEAGATGVAGGDG